VSDSATAVLLAELQPRTTLAYPANPPPQLPIAARNTRSPWPKAAAVEELLASVETNQALCLQFSFDGHQECLRDRNNKHDADLDDAQSRYARTAAAGCHNSDSAALLTPPSLAPPLHDHRIELQRRRLSSGPLAVHHSKRE
jgi:hypothetical protein